MVSLPERDIPLGHKFLEKRDFDQLKELVDSALYKVKRSIGSENPKEEYLRVDLEKLNELKAEVDMYVMQLEVPSWDDYDEFDCEIEQEFY